MLIRNFTHDISGILSRPLTLLLLIGPIAAPSWVHAQTTSIVSGGVYTLISDTSGLALDNEGATATHRVWQWSPGTGNTNQQWQIVSVGGGLYNLICLTSGMALDNGGSTTNGAATTQYNSSPTNTNQQWQIADAGGGYYQLINAVSGKALDNSGAKSNGGAVWQWDPITGNTNQMWRITPVQIGAQTPFTSYEAENGTSGSGASVVRLTSAPTTEFSSPELEASGHAYVSLAATGQSVSWTNNTGKAITAINVRYSIPDAPQGGGITSTLDLYVNGQFRQALSVNSKQTWVYESASDYNGQSKTPSAGYPHVFWDETHAFIAGAAVPPGGTLTLQKDSANSASYYHIDVVDLEAPPGPLSQPANSLSIASCGAVANNINFDSTSAIQNCINSAQSSGSILWIPPGTYYLNTNAGLTATGITIQGAGMWYSTIYYNPPLPASRTSNVIQPNSTILKNFAIDGSAVSRSTSGGNGGGLNIKGNGWVIDSLWIQHEGAGVWADGTNGLVQNCRINNSWADGINLNNGNGGTNNNSGINLTARNNFIRGSGDDGLAINDGAGPGEVELSNITLVQNTVVAPWWANNIGVYGGSNDVVANNLVTDSVKQNGIGINVFGSTSTGDPLLSALVEGNIVLRGGGHGYGLKYPGITVGDTSTGQATVSNVTVRGNTIVDAMFDGLDVGIATGTVIENNTVTAPNLGGFVIDSIAQGNASFLFNTVTNLKSGQPAFLNNASVFSVSGTGNVGFSVP